MIERLLRGSGIYAEREPDDPFDHDGPDPDYFEALVFHLFTFAADGTFAYLREDRSNVGQSVRYEEGTYAVEGDTLVLRYERYAVVSTVKGADPEDGSGADAYEERLALTEGPEGLGFDAPTEGWDGREITRFVPIEACPVQGLSVSDLPFALERWRAKARRP